MGWQLWHNGQLCCGLGTLETTLEDVEWAVAHVQSIVYWVYYCKTYHRTALHCTTCQTMATDLLSARDKSLEAIDTSNTSPLCITAHPYLLCVTAHQSYMLFYHRSFISYFLLKSINLLCVTAHHLFILSQLTCIPCESQVTNTFFLYHISIISPVYYSSPLSSV